MTFTAGMKPWNKGVKGLHLSPATEFKPGIVPWTKGRKGIHLSPSSEFKPGNRPPRLYVVGTVTTRHDKNRKLRQYIKTATGWTEYAKWQWIAYYGPLIPGDVVHHLNGNALDDRLENLIALPRSEHPRIHSRWGIKPLSRAEVERYQSRYEAMNLEATP